MINNPDEVCQDCIWWAGDDTGMQGICTQDNEDQVTTGRFDDCIHFLDRNIEFDSA